MKYWLLKSEPTAFSIDDLATAKNQTTFWDGVRNYQARNMLRDQMHVGDLVLFYHSNCDPPGIVGTAKIVRAGYPDPTQFDPRAGHYDATSTPDKPRWYGVEIKLVEKFHRTLSLTAIRNIPALKNMILLRKGNRLSVMPVSEKEWQTIIHMHKKIIESDI